MADKIIGTATWTKQNLFNPATIKKSTTITLKERLKLLFHKKFKSFDSSEDGSTLVTYKIMNGKTYILDVQYFTPKPSPELGEKLTGEKSRNDS